MKELTLNTKLESLPANLKKEVSDFIDFLISKSSKNPKKKPTFGNLKGKIKMADDFDEPLGDFKDYM